MRRAFISPSKFVQGSHELNNLGYYVNTYGKKGLLVGTKEDIERVQDKLDATAEKFNVSFVAGNFQGEATRNEIERIKGILKDEECDCVIGLGGGKAIDTAKCVAEGKNVIIVPTIVAQDAPTSHSAVLYHEDGSFDDYAYFDFSPSVILIDTEVIAKAPTRYLLSGIADALATYFEARATRRSNSNVNAGLPNGVREGICEGAKGTLTSFALAKLSYDVILEKGLQAKQSSDLNIVTPALEDVIEANVLLSGLGFESGGLAAVHAIYNGISILHEKYNATHGEIVSFGVICQLVMENAPKEELEEVLAFQKSLGLPMCLEDLGLDKLSEEELNAVAEKAIIPEESIHSMPFAITAELVKSSILLADEIGKSYRDQ